MNAPRNLPLKEALRQSLAIEPDRRAVIRGVAALAVAATGVAAAVTAIPAVGLAKGDSEGGELDDPLLKAIQRYNAQIATINATRGLDDDELDEWIDRADAILGAAVKLPVTTKAGALAVIGLVIEDGWTLSQHWFYGDDLMALAAEARDYLASTEGQS